MLATPRRERGVDSIVVLVHVPLMNEAGATSKLGIALRMPVGEWRSLVQPDSATPKRPSANSALSRADSRTLTRSICPRAAPGVWDCYFSGFPMTDPALR